MTRETDKPDQQAETGEISPPHPAQPIYFPPLTIWPSPGYPAHPIAPGGPPPTIWPSPGRPTHPIYMPPGIWPSPGVPTHPIYYPPTIWPDPGVPTHPIYMPPGIWPSPGVPTHPIVIPPEQPPPAEVELDGGYWCVAPYSPAAYVKADDPESAAHNYANALDLTFGTKVIVVTASEAFTVTTAAVEVEHS